MNLPAVVIIGVILISLMLFDKYMHMVIEKERRFERIKTIMTLLINTNRKVWIEIAINNKSSRVSGIVHYFDELGGDIFGKLKKSRFELKTDSQDIKEFSISSIVTISLKPEWMYDDGFSLRLLLKFDYTDDKYYNFLKKITR